MPILAVPEGRIDASTLLGIAKHGERAQNSAGRRRLNLSREWKKYADLVPNIDNKFIEPGRVVQLLRVAGIGFNMPEGAQDMLVEFVGVGTPEAREVSAYFEYCGRYVILHGTADPQNVGYLDMFKDFRLERRLEVVEHVQNPVVFASVGDILRHYSCLMRAGWVYDAHNVSAVVAEMLLAAAESLEMVKEQIERHRPSKISLECLGGSRRQGVEVLHLALFCPPPQPGSTELTEAQKAGMTPRVLVNSSGVKFVNYMAFLLVLLEMKGSLARRLRVRDVTFTGLAEAGSAHVLRPLLAAAYRPEAADIRAEVDGDANLAAAVAASPRTEGSATGAPQDPPSGAWLVKTNNRKRKEPPRVNLETVVCLRGTLELMGFPPEIIRSYANDVAGRLYSLKCEQTGSTFISNKKIGKLYTAHKYTPEDADLVREAVRDTKALAIRRARKAHSSLEAFLQKEDGAARTAAE